jgi:cytochrome P450
MKEAFMPFGIGARGCIGQQLAQMELALMATYFLRTFPNARIAERTTDKSMEIEDRFVFRPKGRRCGIVLA